MRWSQNDPCLWGRVGDSAVCLTISLPIWCLWAIVTSLSDYSWFPLQGSDSKGHPSNWRILWVASRISFPSIINCLGIEFKDRKHQRSLLLLGIGFRCILRRFGSLCKSIKVPFMGAITFQSITKSRKLKVDSKSLTLTKDRFLKFSALREILKLISHVNKETDLERWSEFLCHIKKCLWKNYH